MYDFIVVGSGPAGSCLAARLAKSKKAPSVLLLEAGPAKDASNPNILAERWTSFMMYPNSNWGYKTVPQKYVDNRELDYSRGKGLGGSTIINICAYTVGPKDDYDRWAEEVGDNAFNWENAVRMRKNIESFDRDLSDMNRKYADPDMATHGEHGPVRIEYPKVWETPMTMQLDAAKEAGLGSNLDINNGNPLGLASVPSTARNGRRMTAAVAYLSDAPGNPTITSDAQVTSILFEGDKAVGVVANGTEYRASKDVLLACGAVDTPKLLMLSGIGDKDELASHGIECRNDLPGVGKNLQDHFFTVGAWRETDGMTDWAKLYTNPEEVKKANEQFAKDGTGPMSVFFHGITMGFFKADEVTETPEFAELPVHVQEHIIKPRVPVWEMACHLPPFSPSADPKKAYFSCAIFLHNPQSHGTVKLASSDPKDNPLVDPNFFSHPFDRVCGIAAAKRMLDFVETPLIKKDIIEPLDVPKSGSDEDLLAFWRSHGVSTWHPSCTVKMGKKGNSGACVDSSFRLYGARNLRVVDMSVTPFLPNCHIQSVAYLIGECAAEKMIAEYGLDS